MSAYFLFGTYSPESMKSISKERTTRAADIIRQCGGEVRSMYAMMGDMDLCFITDFQSCEDAMKCSVMLCRTLGISMKSCAAMPVEQFDKMAM